MSSVAVETPLAFGDIWRRVRVPLSLALIGLSLVAIIAAIGSSPGGQAFDPASPDSDGTRALAQLLIHRGVDVTRTRALPGALDRGTAVVVTAPDEEPDSVLHSLAASSADVVLLDPGNAAISDVGVDANVEDEVALDDATLDPGCSLAAAVTAGSVRIRGDLYAANGAVSQRCYTRSGSSALLAAPRTGGASTYLMGSPRTLTNADLGKEGDAALGLSLLNAPRVVWLLPGATGSTSAGHKSLLDLLPDRLLWAVLQLFLAAVVLALWRGRRIGRPVVEPLPVVVRAAETVEGRARLSRAAHARGGAAAALRGATVQRLGRVFRLGSDPEPESVVALVAQRTGRNAADVKAVLYGAEPGDDAALTRLARELPELERDVFGDRPGGAQ